jgi:NADPH-dependent ferric siderophore reductase
MVKTLMRTPANYVLHPVAVTQIEDLAPFMRRFTIKGEALKDMRVSLPGQWMKVFFPAAPGAKPHGRAYTIRHFDATAGEMTLDFVLHGDSGQASKWAGEGKIGDILEIAGPREGYKYDKHVADHLLIGDSTALPAIAAILEDLPAEARPHVFVEVTDALEKALIPRHQNLELTVLLSGDRLSGTTGNLERAVTQAKLGNFAQIWVAGEAMLVRVLRNHFIDEKRVDKAHIQASGYWRVGAADHRDSQLA